VTGKSCLTNILLLEPPSMLCMKHAHVDSRPKIISGASGQYLGLDFLASEVQSSLLVNQLLPRPCTERSSDHIHSYLYNKQTSSCVKLATNSSRWAFLQAFTNPLKNADPPLIMRDFSSSALLYSSDGTNTPLFLLLVHRGYGMFLPAN
jgi:hypothetical protein